MDLGAPTVAAVPGAPGSRWIPNGYFYLVGETQAGKLPTTAGAYQPTGAPLGSRGSTGTYVQA